LEGTPTGHLVQPPRSFSVTVEEMSILDKLDVIFFLHATG